VSIRYLEENQRLGTAGSLSLLPQSPTQPLIVMNGDVLTKVNFHHLLDFHLEHRAPATMCVGKYDIQVPYGVVGLAHHEITGIDEKPAHHFFVNAGIYVLDPDTVHYVPKNSYFDMPTLFQALITEGRAPAAFPLFEYWLDIGKIDDYQRAHGEYPRNFRDQR
jgi:NDP-sugar pyrophosphorylase family protein